MAKNDVTERDELLHQVDTLGRILALSKIRDLIRSELLIPRPAYRAWLEQEETELKQLVELQKT